MREQQNLTIEEQGKIRRRLVTLSEGEYIHFTGSDGERTMELPFTVPDDALRQFRHLLAPEYDHLQPAF